MLSGRISKNIGENIFRSYTGKSSQAKVAREDDTGSTSENTYFHVLVA